MSRLLVSLVALAMCCEVSTGATSYEAVTFAELIARADVIFIGEVLDVRPFPLETRDGQIIKTRVVFRVSDPLWGTTSTIEIFEFLGGELNGIEMDVVDMPKFAVGDRRVVFARRERSINPIVGFAQGLLQVTRDASGVDRILTLEGSPLATPESIGRASAPGVSLTSVQPMSLSDLRASIRRALEARR